MKYGIISALVRGLCIDVTGKPHIAVFNDWELIVPKTAMKAELKSTDSEQAAANIIRSAYYDWKKNDIKEDGLVSVPSCVAVSIDGRHTGVCWIGEDLDSARKCLDEKKTSPLAEIHAKDNILIDAQKRSDVVKNKIALVTGGAQGIGEEITRNLAHAGALVFIADLNINGAKKLAALINENEKRTAAVAVEVNVSSEESVEAMFNTVALTAGGLDICVSNAGVLKAGSVLEQELPDFKFVTDINYTGFFIICKFAGRLLRAQHYTAPDWKTDIIQVNSKSGLEGSNKNGAYAGGKFGGLGLTASFAMELIEYGIKVNAVCPGNFLDGPLWSDPEKGLFVQYLKQGKVSGAKSIADVRSFYESKVPMKRGCTGKDLMRAIYYIIEQEYETGQAVPVTGGQIMLH
ncbi:MAG: SDR family NAD(P)-dependent oxidoreductase [Treponema sp.]|jgi:sorbitol-6-phosphate 2-dehydrogenase|nr:SDR family NAD(P)-dependent oxidoreductase [Treponema sp.]